MDDLIFIALMLVFFIVSGGLLAVCARLMEQKI